MLGAQDLKPRISVTDTTVKCPVKGCSRTVARQLGRFIDKNRQFRCPEHKIYPSRTGSTFVYSDKLDNMVWTDPQDQKLFYDIMPFKRETHSFYHDNSEDAVTWNVFRYLDKTNQLSMLLSSLIKAPVAKAELVYWTYCQREKGVWPELKKAWREFGEHQGQGTEPDLIIVTDRQLFWIEAKLTADNETPRKDDADKKSI